MARYIDAEQMKIEIKINSLEMSISENTPHNLIGIALVKEAVQKQIPKKVNIQRYIYTKCNCGHEFSKHYGDGYYDVPHENKTNYCPDCGQALDWSEKNG